ncbi:ATP-binding protein [Maribacter sp. 2210JD10-5]|uniref:tetratricopeptide repeat-containing sensor histidine kinase n=1 Tax=Maribacter sp. 2210JD10-5 TaxID=3386272 RepID=UPI0039BD6D91
MKSKSLHIACFTTAFILASFCFSQYDKLQLIDSLIETKQINFALNTLKTVDSASLNLGQKAWYYKLFGRSLVLDSQDDLGFLNYLKAKKAYQQIDSSEQVAEVNLYIVQLLSATEFSELDYGPYLNEYVAYAKEQNSPVLLTKAYMLIGKCFINSEPTKTIAFFKKAVLENQKTADALMSAKIHHNVGVLFAEHTIYLDSALYHYDLALKEYQKQNLIDYISYIYNNKATVYKKQGDYASAIDNYLKADSLPIKEYRKNNKQSLYASLADAYEKNNDYGNQAKYLKLHLAYKDSVNEETQNTAMLDIQTKYEVEKKENENLKLKQNKTWLTVGLSILTLLLLLSYLAYKNQLSKKKIAESAKEIEQQKVEKLLKDQEINGIDAMIEGQEKERQRIADDLHDNLGSLLATLKLHFQNFKIRKERIENQEKELLNKTDNLIEEAYRKVRSMAHAKNAGVKSNVGLLPAIKNFAAKVTIVNQLVIDVEDHGMEERLENSLEIGIFRIIQELITNVIKHSKATESTIHLTHHEDNINIMVEDNGIGFDSSKLKFAQGMGLYSIRKRVENINGRLIIDSIVSRGTTIIIDIPTL